MPLCMDGVVFQQRLFTSKRRIEATWWRLNIGAYLERLISLVCIRLSKKNKKQENKKKILSSCQSL